MNICDLAFRGPSHCHNVWQIHWLQYLSCLVCRWTKCIVLYNGKIKKIKMKTKQYVVAYWPQNETYEDAEDFIMSIYELAADLILDDLTIE